MSCAMFVTTLQSYHNGGPAMLYKMTHQCVLFYDLEDGHVVGQDLVPDEKLDVVP